jgi:GTP-binding protein
MARLIAAIVGRPNVGKSTLFNHITGRRISIIDDTPGITRDRIYAETEWRGRSFTLIDTGGIEPESDNEIFRQMKNQAYTAIETADVVLFMVDAKTGVVAADNEVADILRKAGKPVILVVNKVDRPGAPPPEVYECYSLGIDNLIPISASSGLGIGELLDAIYEYFPENDESEDTGDAIKVAVVGKPNTGKSSLINRILNEERVIVSSIPGTTREAVDTNVEWEGRRYVFIDTAGLRRKSRITENIERYSSVRSWASIERADVCIIMIDAAEGATEQDTKIAGYVHEEGKASVIAINKWDLVKKDNESVSTYTKDVYQKLSFMTYSPLVFISAKTGRRLDKLFDLIDSAHANASLRVSTGVLNDVISEAVAMNQPPSDKGKQLKINYATQVDVKPPTFVLFVNDKELMHFSYERYIENTIRSSFGFEGTPIRIIIREKSKQGGR